MTREEALKILRKDSLSNLVDYYSSEELQDAIDTIVFQPSLPSNLDEVTMDFARELDFFLYGSYTPERFPNSMQVRDEHSGLKVNDWKCWVNRPEYRIEMVKHFFNLGKQAGAEWMAWQERRVVDLEKEIDLVWAKCNPIDEGMGVEVANIHIEAFNIIARHFYCLRNRALEEAARHVYESWNGGTMDDVRQDMVKLGKVLNAREK